MGQGVGVRGSSAFSPPFPSSEEWVWSLPSSRAAPHTEGRPLRARVMPTGTHRFKFEREALTDGAAALCRRSPVSRFAPPPLDARLLAAGSTLAPPARSPPTRDPRGPASPRPLSREPARSPPRGPPSSGPRTPGPGPQTFFGTLLRLGGQVATGAVPSGKTRPIVDPRLPPRLWHQGRRSTAAQVRRFGV